MVEPKQGGEGARASLCIALLAAAALCCGGWAGAAGRAPAADNGAAEGPQAAPAEQEGEEEEERFLRGADLQTDYEADMLLRRAREFLTAAEPEYHKAALVLQHLIETAGNALATEDNLIYRPVREKAEELLAQLPEAGLATYRAEVDGQVRSLLGGGMGPGAFSLRDEKTLELVAERFLLSSYGAEAAFVLGCVHLDQHQPLRARRALLRALHHPRLPATLRAQVLLRLAFACHRAGDGEGARAAWTALQALHGHGLPPDALAAVGAAIAEPAPQGQRAEVRPTAEGRFAGPPAASLERPRGLWLVRSRREFDLSSSSGTQVRFHTPAGIVPTGPNATEALRGYLMARWEECGWLPTGAPLVRDRCLFFKANDSVVCLDAETGKVRWEAKPEATTAPRGTHFISFFGGQAQRAPAQPHEIALFGDRLGKLLRIVGDTLYHIEDHQQAQWTRQMGRQVVIVNGRPVTREPQKVPQGNRLAALDAATGKVRWRIGRTLDEKDELRAVRFVALPVPCGARLLVPFETQNELELVALDPATGAVSWRTFLCAYTASQRPPWHEVGVACHGSEVFVSTGQGVVLALDGIDGSVRWASRYERHFAEGGVPMFFYQRAVVGWHENRVFPRGRQLVVLPSDAERVLLLDAQTGAVEREIPSDGLRYCLGLAGDALFAGADDRVVRMALPDGKRVWQLALTGDRQARGRGFLGDDALYIPSGQAILRVASDTGKVETTLRVDLPDDEPVGNLFCDGQAFHVYGLGRVWSLASGALEWAAVSERLADLQKRHAAQPQPPELSHKLAEALLARARLHAGYGRLTEAAADARVAARSLGSHPAQAAARDMLFRTLVDLAAGAPDHAAERLREALTVATTAAQKAEARRALAADCERRDDIEEAVRTLLAIAGPAKDQWVELDSGRNAWRARPDVLAAAGLRRLLAEHGARVTPLLADASAAALKAAEAKPSFEAFQAALRAYPGTPAGIQAGLRAAALEEKQGILERAEIILREMAATGHQPTAAAGVAGLAALHERCGWLRQAHGEWTRLAEEFGDEPVPTPDGSQPARALAAKHLAGKALAEAGAASDPGMPAPPWRVLWEHKPDAKAPYVNAVSYARAPGTGLSCGSQFLEEHIFLLLPHPDGRVVCKRLRDGQTVYDCQMGRGRGQQVISPEANVAVWTGTKATVFGLASGKELWSRDGAATAHNVSILTRMRARWAAAAPDTPVLVVRPDGSTARVHDLATGGVLWERSFRGTAIGWAQGVDRFLVLSGGGNQDLWVCDALTGEFVSTIELKGRYLRAPIVVENGLLVETYGMAGERVVALYDLASGKPRWQVDAREGLRSCFVLDEATVCLQLGNSDLQLLELATGRVRSKIDGTQFEGHMTYQPVLDPTGKQLYVHTYAGDGKMRLSVVDIEAGKITRTVDLGNRQPFHPMLAGACTADGGLMPLVVREPHRREGNRIIASNLAEVKFLDTATGQLRDDLKLPLPRSDGKIENLRSVLVQDGVIVVTAHNWLAAFGCAAEPRAGSHPGAAPDKAPAPASPPPTPPAKGAPQ